mgnify:CR=1 FL=1
MNISIITIIEGAFLLGAACFLAGCYFEAYPPPKKQSYHARIALAVMVAVAVFSVGRWAGVVEVASTITAQRTEAKP